ncbi:MAG: conjugative transposon protein TraK [Chitinophagaceae bacterium]|nr:MAG: conjugative transposon protein TraK [Chitinophagaceae bacterium]
MFMQLKNIDTAFKHVKALSVGFMVVNFLCMVFCIYQSYRMVGLSQERVYVLHNGKVLEALAADRRANLPVELRDHIRTFHGYFFSVSPDDGAIKKDMDKALYLADESAKKEYDNLRESGFYNRMIAANISQEIQVDSIALLLDNYPYKFTCFATEKLVRSSGISYRKLVTAGEVRTLEDRSDENPHGFLIQKWQTLENRDLVTK